MAQKKPIDRLAIDAAAAKTAGLSYGKWRMKQDRIKREKRAARIAVKKAGDSNNENS